MGMNTFRFVFYFSFPETSATHAYCRTGDNRITCKKPVTGGCRRVSGWNKMWHINQQHGPQIITIDFIIIKIFCIFHLFFNLASPFYPVFQDRKTLSCNERTRWNVMTRDAVKNFLNISTSCRCCSYAWYVTTSKSLFFSFQKKTSSVTH